MAAPLGLCRHMHELHQWVRRQQAHRLRPPIPRGTDHADFNPVHLCSPNTLMRPPASSIVCLPQGGEGFGYDAATAVFRSRISTANGAAPMVRNPKRIIVHPNPATSPSQPYSTGAIIPEP